MVSVFVLLGLMILEITSVLHVTKVLISLMKIKPSAYHVLNIVRDVLIRLESVRHAQRVLLCKVKIINVFAALIHTLLSQVSVKSVQQIVHLATKEVFALNAEILMGS